MVSVGQIAENFLFTKITGYNMILYCELVLFAMWTWNNSRPALYMYQCTPEHIYALKNDMLIQPTTE